jgi:hypothetical protein
LGSSVVIENTTFQGNAAVADSDGVGGDGGAIHLQYSVLRLSGSTFVNNTASR